MLLSVISGIERKRLVVYLELLILTCLQLTRTKPLVLQASASSSKFSHPSGSGVTLSGSHLQSEPTTSRGRPVLNEELSGETRIRSAILETEGEEKLSRRAKLPLRRSKRSLSSEEEESMGRSEDISGDNITITSQLIGDRCGQDEMEIPMSLEEVEMAKLMGRHYKLESNYRLRAHETSNKLDERTSGSSNNNVKQIRDEKKDNQDRDRDLDREKEKIELPKPTNVTVLIISWYPPILKLSWTLNELNEVDANRLDFYDSKLNNSNLVEDNVKQEKRQQQHKANQLLDQFDLELALDGDEAGSNEGDPIVNELRERRLLVRKSLTCFQVIYNMINSRYKVIEEYPPYLRSIMLERLLPATEYSLNVVAIYLGKYKLFSERVQFVSPTDNESRRFKENTYRPIHRYPDERRDLRIGLAQVRSEELTIVAFAVFFWIATICLFFNKWGKIRMLEPYQPAYRETSAGSFAHHHPSAHTLAPNAAVAVAAAASPGLLGVAYPPGLPGEELLVAGSSSPVPLEGSLPIGEKQQPSNRSLMLLSNRFDTIADEAPMRRTYTELNYLFQSKAQALAKATSMWSKQQAALRQQQPQQLRPPKLVQPSRQFAIQSEYELLRKASQVSSMLRPRLAHRESFALAAGLGRTTTQQGYDNNLSMLQRTQPGGHKSLDGSSAAYKMMEQTSGGRLTPTRSERGELGRGTSLTTRGQLLRFQRHCQSQFEAEEMDQQQTDKQLPDYDDGTCDLKATSNKDNRLRRLLFINKTHQHHHIATSTSSSTLAVSSNQLEGGALKLNSISLDSDPQSCRLGKRNNGEQVVAASSSSLPTRSNLSEQVQATSTINKSRALKLQESLPRIEVPSGGGGANRNTSHEHHILIEPPSPPQMKQAMDQTRMTTTDSGSYLRQRHHQQQQQLLQDSPEGHNMAQLASSQSVQQVSLGGERQYLEPDGWLATGQDSSFGQVTGLKVEKRNRRTARRSTCPAWLVEQAVASSRESSNSNWNLSSNSSYLGNSNDRQVVVSQLQLNPSKRTAGSSLAMRQPEICLETAPGSSEEELEAEVGEGFNLQLATTSASAGSGSEFCCSRQQDNWNYQASLVEGRPFVKLAGNQNQLQQVASCSKRQLADCSQETTTTTSMAPPTGQFGPHCNACRRHQSLSGCMEEQLQLQQEQQACPACKLAAVREATRERQRMANWSQEEDSMEHERPRMSSVFVASPYSRAHRDSFALLRALSQKKSKSAEDVAYLSSLVLQIWVRDRNPLLASVSQQQLSTSSPSSNNNPQQQLQQRRQSGGLSHEARQRQRQTQRSRPKSSLTVAHI